MDPTSPTRRVLLAASTGGHLQQLWRLWPRLREGGLSAPPVWLTFDTPQSRSLLQGEEVEMIPYIAPKDVIGVARGLRACDRIMRRHGIGTVVSTGSAIALAAFPAARARGARCHYIESAARCAGPSVTGRIVHRIPGVRTYSQYRRWGGDGWPCHGSVFDEFEASTAVEPRPIRRLVVTLGTIPFPFDGAIDPLLGIIPPEVEVFWQLGDTRRPDLPGAHGTVPHDELRAALASSDAVIAHAGTGSALAALDAGRIPVLLPRRRDRGEHTDDHQRQLAEELAERGLAIHARPEAIRWSDVERAARATVTRRPGPPILLS